MTETAKFLFGILPRNKSLFHIAHAVSLSYIKCNWKLFKLIQSILLTQTLQATL